MRFFANTNKNIKFYKLISTILIENDECLLAHFVVFKFMEKIIN
jgi:hypothetical protein